jgi:hypothetical protein
VGTQRREIKDDGPQWLQDFDSVANRVEVDVEHLADFAVSLRADLERNFVGHYHVVCAKATSATQPVLAAVEVVRARALLAKRLNECVQGLADHLMAAAWLANAADELAKRYVGADAFAAAKVDDVAARMPAPPRPAGTMWRAV